MALCCMGSAVLWTCAGGDPSYTLLGQLVAHSLVAFLFTRYDRNRSLRRPT
jgi:hypothetical protein